MNKQKKYEGIRCGRVFDPQLPFELASYEPPIKLAQIILDMPSRSQTHVQLKFSEFISFTLAIFNPKLALTYRLVRYSYIDYRCESEILQEWAFGLEGTRLLEINNVATIQPTVLNYVDTLMNWEAKRYTYELQLTTIETSNVLEYALINKSFIATYISQETYDRRDPTTYLVNGNVKNPLLPLSLTPQDNPVSLAEVMTKKATDREENVFINFSGFVTSNLKGTYFNDLVFKLIKVRQDGCVVPLDQWAFRRAFINQTEIKEPIVYNYCDTLQACTGEQWTYKMLLVDARLSEESFYDITNKSLTAQVYPAQNDLRRCGIVCSEKETYREMWNCQDSAFSVCGEINKVENSLCDTYEVSSEDLCKRDKHKLAYLVVEEGCFETSKVLINYSQNFSFTLDGFNPRLETNYLLKRTNLNTGEEIILETWTYQVSEVIPTEVAPITSIEPLVLNYCDTLCGRRGSHWCYEVELVPIEEQNTSFTIVPKSFVAIVSVV